MRASLLVLLAACGGFIDNQAASSTHRILVEANRASARLPDIELARAALPGGLVQLEAFARAYPRHRAFKQLHADALCQYAIAFVFDDWEDAALSGRADEASRIAGRLTGLLAACVDANLALLPPAWRAARGSDAFAALLPRATAADAPALLWIASADAIAIALDPVRQLARVPATIAALERSCALAPGARDAAGELLLAMFPGRSAGFAAARRHLGDGGLIVDVLEARTLARDRAELARRLERVLAADLARWPERRLANELALRKARRYLAVLPERPGQLE